jgi:glycosyltransferase involved in cell wall biosynthesis
LVKVLHIISDTNIGGAGNLLLNYLHSHDSGAFSVSVAMPRGGMLKERILPLGIRVHELDCLRDKSFDTKAIKALARLIREDDPDIVHTHGALSGRIAGKRCGKRVVFTRHSGFISNPAFTKGLGRVAFKFINERYADRIIATSGICRDDLVSCGVSASRIDVILNGSPPMPRLDIQERSALRRDYGFSPDEFLAGIVARIEPYKGQMFVVEAARILKGEGRSMRFVIAGTGTQEADVKKCAEELGLGGDVVFPGFVHDVAGLLGILDVQINASYVETTSLSLLEGMSMGLPAVASDESGNPWVIKDGVNGLLFKSRDSSSLAACVARIQDSPELAAKLSAGAVETFNREFTSQRLARETEATYMKTMEA